MRNKKGISAVVATLLLILFTLAAALILANYLIPFVKSNLEKSTECMNYKDYYKFNKEFVDANGQQLDYNCKTTTGTYGLSIENANTKEDISEPRGIAVVFIGRGTSSREDIINGSSADTSNVGMLSGETTIELPEKGGTLTYLYPSNQEFSEMEIHPILKNGRTCEASDKIKISDCVGTVLT